MYACSGISPCMTLATNPIVRNLISVFVLTNTLGHNLISVLGLTNLVGCNLISVLGLTNPLGHKLISALGLTSHINFQTMLMILLCLAAPFFNSPRLFLFSISLIFVINQPLLKCAPKDGSQAELEPYTEATQSISSEVITCTLQYYFTVSIILSYCIILVKSFCVLYK